MTVRSKIQTFPHFQVGPHTFLSRARAFRLRLRFTAQTIPKITSEWLKRIFPDMISPLRLRLFDAACAPAPRRASAVRHPFLMRSLPSEARMRIDGGRAAGWVRE